VADKTGILGKALRFSWFVLAVIVFGLVIAIRIRLLAIPLERDEGEYAYAGQLMLQGIPPYKLAYNMKFPGTYAAYAVIMSMFGQTIAGIHLGLLLVNAATVTLIFFLGRRLLNTTAGLVATLSYSILSVCPSVLGFAAHASHFVMLPVLGGTLLLMPGRNRPGLGRLFGSGLLFGLALLMKQPGALFIIFAAAYLISEELHDRPTLRGFSVRILVFGCAVILPFAITCLVLLRAGVFQQFWFWTIDYAREYGSLVPLKQTPQFFLQRANEVIGANWALWMLAGIGAVAGLWNQRMRASTLFILGFFVVSVLVLCPGFYFRHHYFIFVLPGVSLLVGLAASALSDLLIQPAMAVAFVPIVLIAASLSWPIVWYRQIFFDVSPVEATRMIYGASPFPESVRIGDYLREHTSPDETIAVLGSEPQIYFYSQRHSATGYIYAYALMEPQKYARRMQEEIISEIERASPRYVVSVAIYDSWLPRPGSDLLIFKWASEYTAHNYSAAGFVNITPTGSKDYFGDIPASVEVLENYILIYQRNP
jgi:4-amino-4-deoxy-L-arabinose transferase-like glycosyltransferase